MCSCDVLYLSARVLRAIYLLERLALARCTILERSCNNAALPCRWLASYVSSSYISFVLQTVLSYYAASPDGGIDGGLNNE